MAIAEHLEVCHDQHLPRGHPELALDAGERRVVPDELERAVGQVQVVRAGSPVSVPPLAPELRFAEAAQTVASGRGDEALEGLEQRGRGYVWVRDAGWQI